MWTLNFSDEQRNLKKHKYLAVSRTFLTANTYN